MKPPNTVPFALLTCVLLSGCVTKKDQTADQKTKDEYVYYTPTGSNIPVRVKKSDIQTTDADTQATQDALRDLQTRGSVEHHQ